MSYQELMALLLAPDAPQKLRAQEESVFALLPELAVCKGFDQKNSWHVYDVYEHILHVVEGTPAQRVLRLTALFHDLGKPLAFTVDAQGVGHFYGHWERSMELFQKYAPLLALPQQETQLITALVFYHDVNPDQMTSAEREEMIERLGRENLPLLFAIKRADLLAQSAVYRHMMSNIDRQERELCG